MNYLLIIVSFIILFVFFTWLIMFGWELSIVPIFGLKSITFSQAIGLNLVGNVFRTSQSIKKD